jgi:hypothetical protein
MTGPRPTCDASAGGIIHFDGTVFRGCDGARWYFLAGNRAPYTWSFTTCGKTGRTGPSQADCDTAYTGTSLAGDVTLTGGIQSWTVPEAGTYQITVWGASGGEGTYQSGNHPVADGGRGAMVSGEFDLAAGQVLQILVGQAGVTGRTYEHQPGGGGGGTFVVLAGNTPLIIAGGGGGGHDPSYGGEFGGPGQIETTGETVQDNTLVAAGGAAGSGGVANGSYCSSGAGFSGNAAAAGNVQFTAQSFLGGGTGGQASVHALESVGGFGGGGHGQLCAGGGGGYSGGGAVCGWSAYGRAGGGGSFNAGANAMGAADAWRGAGKVRIVQL